MEMSPQRVRGAEFKTVRKGADPDEVKLFLNDVADELERAQNQSTAMEARARAAVARLQEVSGSTAAAAAPAPVAPHSATPEASADEADTISRTLLLAQRTADTAVAEARSEAAKIVAGANDESAKTLDSTREMAAQMIAEARVDARRLGETERQAIFSEVEALKARRDFLESDVEQLELFLTEQRSRLREAATSLVDITERIPGGLGGARPPLLSASDDVNSPSSDLDAVAADDGDAAVTDPWPPQLDTDRTDDIDEIDDTDDADDIDDRGDTDDDVVGATGISDTEAAVDAASPWGEIGDEPTQSIPRVAVDSDARAEDDFRFSFDDDRR